MNPVLVKRALEKIPNPSVLINIISRRVRQLNLGAGPSRPLVQETVGLGAADIALREVIEEKMAFEMAPAIPLTRPSGKGRSRPQHWARV